MGIPHNHPMREPKADRCSCCLEQIYSQTQNVVQVNKIPETIMNDKGEVIDKTGIVGPQAYFHASCFMAHLGQDVQMECDYCGIFKMATTAQKVGKNWEKELVPIAQVCDCQCHSGHQYECSKIRIFKGSEKALGTDRQFEKWKRREETKQKEGN